MMFPFIDNEEEDEQKKACIFPENMGLILKQVSFPVKLLRDTMHFLCGYGLHCRHQDTGIIYILRIMDRNTRI